MAFAVARVLLGFAIRFFVIAPGRIERGQNRNAPVALNLTPAAQTLHATLDVADMHADKPALETRPVGAVRSRARDPRRAGAVLSGQDLAE
ncbi:hypothetical protein A5906_14740 [Bradyrhizobium sacchari]|uniref:hypothetical protein n=1 Tax=Bradyrhizobium sacchari TaxID=1399419 RepID=UPI0009D46E9E|nr:hypothetical protein [Bradyrhizobium sacchari]OPY94211.1 hypothetical protein A5906_14740 [Bradyrhizobium sacchari]